MLPGRAKSQDDLVFGVVQVIGIFVVFYFACSRGREIVAGVAFLVFSLVLFVLAGGLILFLVRRALHRSPLLRSSVRPKTPAENSAASRSPETDFQPKAVSR
jgi:hypothetical protein